MEKEDAYLSADFLTLLVKSLMPAVIFPGPKLSFLFPSPIFPANFVFKNNLLPLFPCPPLPHLFSVNRGICLKPGSLNSHPTHLLKPQLVLEEVDDVLKRFMNPSKGTRGENQGSMYHRALLLQRFLWRKWPMAS